MRRIPFAILWLAVAINLLAAAVILLSTALGQAADRGIIAFVSNREGYAEIFLIDVATGSTRKLVNGEGDPIPVDESYPQWSPDGRHIAFTGYLGNTDGQANAAQNSEVFIVDAAGGNLTNVTRHEANVEYLADWSPDSTHMLFLSNRNWYDSRFRTRRYANLFVLDAPAGVVQPIGDFELPFATAHFSPDGTQIVFEGPSYLKRPHSAADIDRGYEIYMMNADGSNLRPVTDNNQDDGLPVWSPDGSQIAFISPRAGDTTIYVVDADGGNLRRLASGSLGNGFNTAKTLAWSPDGRYLATVFHVDGEIPDIYRIDVAIGESLDLSNHPAWDQEPAWSPDGAQIAFMSSRDGNWEIYVMDADGGNPRRLTNHPADDYSPVWWPGTGANQRFLLSG